MKIDQSKFCSDDLAKAFQFAVDCLDAKRFRYLCEGIDPSTTYNRFKVGRTSLGNAIYRTTSVLKLIENKKPPAVPGSDKLQQDMAAFARILSL